MSELLTANLQEFANVVNSMGTVVMDRFGQTSLTKASVAGPGTFTLHKEWRAPAGNGGQGSYSIELSNIKSVLYRLVSFKEFGSEYPNHYLVNILLKQERFALGQAYDAVAINCPSDEVGRRIKALLDAII